MYRTRNWKLDSTSLQQRVHEPSVPAGLRSARLGLETGHFGAKFGGHAQWIRRFGLLIVRLTQILVLLALLVNLLFHGPWLASFLFAVALAVGLTPSALCTGIKRAPALARAGASQAGHPPTTL